VALKSKKPLEITDGYRGARRLTSLLCAVGLGWSTAQFEVKSLSLGPAGTIDLSNASFSLTLACGIIYMMVRCTIEFAMQPIEVRRWHLAQSDFRLSVFLVQATLLMLAAGGLNRSVDTILYVAIGTLVLMVAAILLLFLGMRVLMPLRMHIRERQGRVSVAYSVIEAEGWAWLIAMGIIIALLVALGVASLQYEPLRSVWITPPSPIAVAIFIATAIAIIISVAYQWLWERKLFAHPAPYTTKKLPDGRIGVTLHRGSKMPPGHAAERE